MATSTINLNTPEVSVREIRLGSITGFHGNASELVDCSQCGKLKDKKRSVSVWDVPRLRQPV